MKASPVRFLLLGLFALLAGGAGYWWWTKEQHSGGALVLQGNVEVRQVNLGGAMTESLVSIDALTKRFDDRGPPAIENLTTTIGAGQVTGLVGPDGSGKTTLMRLIAALLAPSQGRIVVCGFDSMSQGAEIHDTIGYMMRRPYHRNRVKPEFLRGKQTAMASNDVAGVVDQDRIQPPELDDRGRDLCDLVIVMRAGVARIRDQPRERHMLDGVR